MTAPALPSLPADPLGALGWDAHLHTSFADLAAVSRPARVSAVERGVVSVLAADGAGRASIGPDLLAAVAADPLAAPGVGDWVALRDWPDGRCTVEHVLPRRTALVRHDAGRTSVPQLLAAGVDVVAVVEPLWPEPETGRIERLLVLAWESGAQPVVLLTKSDLAADADLLAEELGRAAPGAGVITVSTVTGDGLDTVRGLVGSGGTLALVGPSGAGKSSLVNALVGVELLATREVRRDGKGRHASTRRELIVLPDGGVLVDTPGLRGVGLTGDVEAGLAAAFEDVEQLAGHCRFGDCGHDTEPGCAVLQAIEEGTLEVRRLESWRKLQREAAWVARRTDARLRAEERAVWKRRTKQMRAQGPRHDPRRTR